MMVSILRERAPKLALWRRRGGCLYLGGSVVVEACSGGAGRAAVALMLLWMLAASKGAPTSSGVVRSELEAVEAGSPPGGEGAAMGEVEVWDDGRARAEADDDRARVPSSPRCRADG